MIKDQDKLKARVDAQVQAKAAKERVDAAFARAENEDDDGYDPWSDRPARREALFEEDPWR